MNKLFLLAWFLFTAGASFGQWDPEVRLTNNPAYSWTSINNQWCVTTSGDNVHILFYDDRDGNNEIYYKHSSDGGLSWGDDTRLTTNSADSYHPSIALSGSFVHVAWSDRRDGNYEVYYKHSTDGGTTWGEDIRLTTGDSSSFNPSVAVSGLTVNIIWYDIRSGNWEIYDKRSTDGGLTWEPDRRLTNDPANSFDASIAVSDSIVNIVWGDFRDGVNGEIYYKRSSDGGLNWGQDIRLTTDVAVSRRPCVAVYGSEVHVAWYDFRNGNNEIYYKRSTDGGTHWEGDTRLTVSSGNSFNPSVAVSGSAVHIVWYDTRDNDLELYYERSEDKGLTWGGETRLTDSPGASEYPSIAISGAVVHVVWTDLRDGNAEIYYKRDPTGGYAMGTDNESPGNFYEQTSLYPNPASSTITVIPGNYSDDNTILTIRNVLGEEVFSKHVQNETSVIDISGLPNGLYFSEISTSGKLLKSRKLIILR